MEINDNWIGLKPSRGKAHPQKENAPVVEPLGYIGWMNSLEYSVWENQSDTTLAEAYAAYRVEFERTRLLKEAAPANSLRDLSDDEVDGIKRGLDDLAHGRTQSLSDIRRELSSKEGLLVTCNHIHELPISVKEGTMCDYVLVSQAQIEAADRLSFCAMNRPSDAFAAAEAYIAARDKNKL